MHHSASVSYETGNTAGPLMDTGLSKLMMTVIKQSKIKQKHLRADVCDGLTNV